MGSLAMNRTHIDCETLTRVVGWQSGILNSRVLLELCGYSDVMTIVLVEWWTYREGRKS